MALHGGELARRLVDRLYAATTTKEARLCKVALGALADAEIQRAFTEDVIREACGLSADEEQSIEMAE